MTGADSDNIMHKETNQSVFKSDFIVKDLKGAHQKDILF